MPARKKPTPTPAQYLTHYDLLRHHYYRVMPNKKHHRVMVWVAFFACSAIVAAQMLYPLDRALPLARLGNEMVAWHTHADLAKKVTDKFNNTKIVVKTNSKSSHEYPLGVAGAEPLTESMVLKLEDYPFWWRFVPLSILWQPAWVDSMQVELTAQPLAEFAEARAAELSLEPVNARLAIEKGVLLATPDRSGSTVEIANIVKAVVGAKVPYGRNVTVSIAEKLKPAAKTTADFAAVKTQAEAALARPVNISAGGKTFAPSNEEKASWLVIGSGTAGKTTLSVDSSKVEAYINGISAQVGRPAGQTHVTIENGRETSRVVGENGLKINSGPLIDLLTNYILAGKGKLPFAAELVDLAPTVIYNNQYTATQEGLQAYINDMSRRGAWIMIQQIGGNGWAVNARATESVPSASTYKIFVAKRLFQALETGETTWDSPILDTNVDGCFNRMTIASTNPCAVEWLARFGRENMNNYVYSLGFSTGTSFTNPQAVHTTAADLTKYMIGLENGSLVGGAYRDRLLHSLSTHPYRYGIPTGSQGRVYDKVGFLWDYVHDSAIVYHPRGTYVMTIMTKGQSYAAIATMTREIERIMYP